MPASDSAPPGLLPSDRVIENLLATYAELVDDGDFAALGALLADATFTGSGPPVSGPDAIEKMFGDTLVVYDDGTPRTRHVITNMVIEVDESTAPARGDPARARKSGSACQCTSDRPGGNPPGRSHFH